MTIAYLSLLRADALQQSLYKLGENMCDMLKYGT